MAQSNKELTDRILAALKQDEFVLYVQRIVPLAPQQDEKGFMEIFVRFSEEDTRLLPPGSFFPVLEEFGMLPYLDRWVVNRLARWIRSARKLLPDWETPRHNINLSQETIVDPDFPQYVMQYIEKSYLAGRELGLEIPCESAQADLAALQRLVSVLRPHGCTLTLSGYDGSESGLALLKTMQPEFVKFNTGTVNPVKIAELNRTCHALNARTIAEYVENERVLEHLRSIKVDFAQGFAVSPVEAL
jgi:EAL domain-containing protein (putative c-di-GMP-specific phosphodiesterase class I)